MDLSVKEAIETILVNAGFSPDSSAELAFHIALHYPEHGAVLVQRHSSISEE